MEVDIIEDTNKATEKIEQPSLEKNIVEFNLNDWHYSQTNSSITLNSYKGTSKEIYIPGEYNSKQVILGLNFYFPRDPVSIDIIEVNGKKVKLTNNSLNQRFYGSNAQRVNLTGLDVSNVTNMTNVFRGAKYLTELDISNWDTSNVTNMALMFNGAESLEQLDLSSWDTSNVTNMDGMFYGCKSLIKLDVSGWNTSKTNNMFRMFYGCESLTQLDVSNWNTSNVTTMETMFYGCKSLTQLDLSRWDTSNVTTMESMFYDCESLTQLDISNWNTSNVTNMGYMFRGAKSLINLDVSGWNTANVTTMEAMFSRNESLTQLDASNWDTSNVINMAYMFYYSNITQLDASNWDTSNVTNMNYMFRYYENSNGLPLLVITTDNKLANYYYKGDWRLPAAPRFDANGGIFSDGSSTSKPLEIFTIENISEATIQQKLNDALALVETPTKVGNSFNGWENLNTSTNIIDKLNSNFLAKWNVNSYKVTYETDGGSAVPEADVTFDELINEPTAPTKEGYTFDGWYKEADYQNIWDFATEKMPASNVTLYAKWTINSYNVTFDSQGGSSVPGGTVNFDELVAKPQDPTREGYKFEGWYTDDT
ncbi:BspA family leucine-rich repeat surface protein, partial [Clostridium tertium]